MLSKSYTFIYALFKGLIQWEVKQMKAFGSWSSYYWGDEMVGQWSKTLKSDRCCPSLESTKFSIPIQSIRNAVPNLRPCTARLQEGRHSHQHRRDQSHHRRHHLCRRPRLCQAEGPSVFGCVCVYKCCVYVCGCLCMYVRVKYFCKQMLSVTQIIIG